MKVYEALSHAFRSERVTNIFGIMGNANMYWWYAMDQSGVAMHPTRHEGAALTMAEGWARATGEPGCCVVTQGPGVTQLGSALTVASRGRIPLVVFGGDCALGARDNIQYLDQRRFVEATETAFVPLFKADEVNDVVREAFYIARSQSRPVFLNVPMDVQALEYDGELDDYEPSTLWNPEPQRVLPNPDRLRAAADLLARSERPVIVVGRGAQGRELEPEIKQLADRVGALLATTLPVKGWGNDSPFHAGITGLYATRTGLNLFSGADLVLGLGATLNRHTLATGYVFGEARYIQVDLRPNLVMGNRRVADVYLQGDAQLTVRALDRLLDEDGVRDRTGYRTPDVQAMLKETNPDPREFELDPGTVDPRRAATLIDDALPAEVGLIMGNAHSSAIATLFMCKRRSLQWDISAFGCIGQTLPTAIGAAKALAPNPLAVIDGDASMLMHINELETAARLQVKLLMITLNDEAWGAEYQKLLPQSMDVRSSLVPTPDIGEVARAFGCRGTTIRDLNAIKPAIEEFLTGDGPMMLDIRVSKTVASVPYRRVRFGEDV